MNVQQFKTIVGRYIPPAGPGEYIIYLRDGRSLTGTYNELDELSQLVTIGDEIVDINMIVSMKRPPPAP